MAAANSERLEVVIAAATDIIRREMPIAAKSVEDFVAVSEQHIDKLEQRFSGINVDGVKRAIANVREDFTKNFTEIQKLAAKAVQTPITPGNGLNLGSAEAKAAAAAAQQQALATRAIADAAERSVAGVAHLTLEQKNFVAAARAAATASELEARQLAAQAGQVERLEIELKQAGAAQLVHAAAQGRVIAVTGAQRAGMQQLSYNISDVATQFASGTPPMLIFAQQGSQVVQAVALMKQESGGLIGFLGGPWGAAILGAVSVLGMLWTAHEKAADAEKEHGKAADSLKEAVDRLNGATAANNHQTQQGIIDDINAAKALYAREAATRKNIVAELELAKARLSATLASSKGPGTTGSDVQAIGAGREAKNIQDLEHQIKEQQVKINTAATAVTVGIGKILARDVGAATDPRTAAQQKYDDAVDAAQRAFEKSGDGAKYRAAMTTAAAVRDASLKLLDKSKTKGGDTAARQAEAARQRELSEDISFNEESRKLRHELLNSRGNTAQSEAERAKIAREDIQIELEAREKKYELLVQQGKLTEAEAAHLGGLAEQVAIQKRLNLKLEERSRIVQEQLNADRAGLNHEIAMLRIRYDMAKTMQERKEIARRILEKEQEMERRATQAILDDPSSTPAQKAQAERDKKSAEERHKAEGDRVNDMPDSPLDAYLKTLPKTADQVNEAISQIKADGLKSLEDGLVDIITGTRKMGDVFKQIANQIIADLIRVAIQQLIVKAISASIGFADGGGIGSSGGSIFSLPKFAGGGMFSGPGGPRSDNLLAWVSPGEYIINADSTKKWLPIIQAINDNRLPKFANGGAVGDIRMPVMRQSDLRGSARGKAGIVQQFDLRGAVVQEKLYDHMQRLADDRIRAAAPEIVQASTLATQRDLRRARLG